MKRNTWLLAGLALLVPAVLYLRTCAPSVVVGDSAEFQTEAWRLGVTHPTGYPLYLLLGKAFTLLPVGDVAYRLNLLSVASALAALGFLFAILLALTRRPSVAVAGTWLAAAGPALWSQSVIAEVYPLNAALTLAALWALLRWGDTGKATWLRWAALAVGLGLAHHRTIVLLLPAAALYLLLAARSRTAWRRLWPAAPALVLPALLYLYVPLRWTVSYGRRPGLGQLYDYLFGRGYGYALRLSALHDWARWRAVGELAVRQVTWGGIALAAIGALALARRRPRELALTGVALATYLLFGQVYQVPDAAVFFIPAWLLVALWAGVGAGALGDGLARVLRRWNGRVGEVAALLPAALAAWLAITGYAALDRSGDRWARTLADRALAQPPQAGALVICDFERLSALRYAFGVERPGLRIEPLMPDTEAAALEQIGRALATGRPLYLARGLPGIAGRYRLTSEGPLVRVSGAPGTAIPAEARRTAIPFRDGQGVQVVALVGSQAVPTVRRAEDLHVTFYWQALFGADRQPQPYQVHLRLVDAQGRPVGRETWGHPVSGLNPLNAWLPGEVVADDRWLPVDPTVEPGRYRLEAGWALPFGGEGLQAADGAMVPVAEVTVLPNPGWRPAPQHRLQAHFTGGVELLGFDLSGRPAPGRQLAAMIYLRDRSPQAEGLLRLSLEGADGRPVAAAQAELGPSHRWAPGEVQALPLTLSVPATTEVSQAELRLALQSRAGEPWEARWGWWGRGPALVLMPVRLEVPPASPGRRLLASFDERMMLLGYELSATEVAPGQALRATFYWWAMSPLEEDYSVFVHLLDGAGTVRWQHDGMPGFGMRPTRGWRPGEVVTDVHEVQLPPDAPAASYQLEVGVYSAATWQRLPVLGQQGAVQGDRLLLDTIRIAP